LFEELGIKSNAGKIIVESEYRYEHGSFRILAIQTTISENNFSLKIHDEVEWVIFPLLINNIAPADIPIAEAIVEKNGEF
jgi:hypothetical protein